MTRSAGSPHPARAVLALACVVLASLVPVAAASAQSPPVALPVSFSGVNVTVIGDGMRALAMCVNAAKAEGKVQQFNPCQNLPLAVGGTVTLDHVHVLVTPQGSTVPQRFANVSIEVRGGDALALAECINQAKSGKSKSDVTGVTGFNSCTNVVPTFGGLVLTNVTITIRQVGPGG